MHALLRRLLLSLLCALSTPWAWGQVWAPNKPVRLIIPQVPGGGADAIGRVIAQGISEQIGQPVVADNRPGTNGGVGVEALRCVCGGVEEWGCEEMWRCGGVDVWMCEGADV